MDNPAGSLKSHRTVGRLAVVAAAGGIVGAGIGVVAHPGHRGAVVFVARLVLQRVLGGVHHQAVIIAGVAVAAVAVTVTVLGLGVVARGLVFPDHLHRRERHQHVVLAHA